MSAVLIAALASSCFSANSDKQYPTRAVSQSDYADDWPFKELEALIACEPGGSPTVTVHGNTFGLDGEAPKPAMDKFLAHPEASAARKLQALNLLREDALSLC